MKKNRFSPAKATLTMLCMLLGILFTFLLSGTLYFCATATQLGYSVPDITGEIPQNLSDSGSVETVNILLIGQDHLDGQATGRSDSILVCSFHPQSGKLTFTSFLRDLYVPIPGHGSNRLNAAYAFGGADLLRRTMEENFGISISGCVEVDFGQFSQIIDLLGGVELELRRDEAELISDETGTSLQEGVQLLNGQQALCYSRIRKLDTDGDFSRTARQRRVIGALLESYRGAPLPTLLKTLMKLAPMITTDMNTGEMFSHVMAMFPHLKNAQIVSQTIPAKGQYWDKTIDGMAVLEADMDELRDYLNKSLAESQD